MDPGEEVWAVALEPQDLRELEAGDRRVARAADELGPREDLFHPPDFLLRALVVPKGRRKEETALPVQEDRPVHLPGKPQAHHLQARKLRRQGPEHLLQGPGPVLGVLLRPARPRGVKGVTGPGLSALSTLLVQHQGLEPARSQVQADGRPHPRTPRRYSTASWSRRSRA